MSIPFLVGKNIYLRALTESDASGPYPRWLNDSEMCQGNSHHVFPYSREDALVFIGNVNSSRHQLTLAIIVDGDDTHIGNIALNQINNIDRTAGLAIMIGDKSCWGKGYGKEAARLICGHGFLALNLNRISCGTFDGNRAMSKLAEYLGMTEEGRRRQAAFKNGCYVDIVEYGILKSEYLARFDLHQENVVTPLA